MKIDDRYTLAETSTGALLLDLANGTILELNESSKVIWQLALAGQPEAAIAASLSQRHALDPDTARAHVRHALTPPPGDVPVPPQTDFNYARHGAEYVLRFRGETVLIVDERGESVMSAATPDGVSLPYLLQAIAPKVLALRGQVVLHASAVALGDHALAFSGFSGAGKTSAARAFVNAGAQPICEDKLLLQVGEAGTLVAPLGERAITEWAAATAEALRSSQPATCAGLDRAMQGKTMRLAEIGFLDAQRRTPGPYAAAALSETETAGAVFRNAFYGSDANRDWIRHLRTAAQIGQTVRGFNLTVPDGLERLAEAAAEPVRARSLSGRSVAS
jgi:coenzyme PQQ synthesis protein D (PqqD)